MEKGKLDKRERTALSKVFENDIFIKDLLKIRSVGSHIQSDVALRRGALELRHKSGASIHLVAETSAKALFEAAVTILNDAQGRPKTINHLENLEEAKKRIAAAFDMLSIRLY